MKLKQLSIFLENSPGRLYEVMKAFGSVGINVRAHCICDSSHDFGVLRILVSDINTARDIMMARYVPARIDDVVAIEIEDAPGSLSQMLELFLGTGVNVEYMYAVAGATYGRAVMIFSFSDIDLAITILRRNNVKLLNAEAFGILDSKG